jgi:hypothetical protein
VAVRIEPLLQRRHARLLSGLPDRPFTKRIATRPLPSLPWRSFPRNWRQRRFMIGAPTGRARRSRCLTGRQYGATMAGMRLGSRYGNTRVITAAVIALVAVAVILLASF